MIPKCFGCDFNDKNKLGIYMSTHYKAPIEILFFCSDECKEKVKKYVEDIIHAHK